MMELSHPILEQARRHPALQPQDALKLCFQCAFGAEHQLSSIDNVRASLQHEFSLVDQTDEPLFEPIGNGMLRVHLGAWKRLSLPIDWLLRLFYATAGETHPDAQSVFQGACMAITSLAANSLMPFSLAEWLNVLNEYPVDAPVALHHSDRYRAEERPHYRIVSPTYRMVLEIFQRLPMEHAPILIAIDGKAASGKSTLSEQLRSITDCSVLHMDDFFVPFPLRTEERMREVGGNIDYERFCTEVLLHLANPKPFSYRIYSCQSGSFVGRNRIDSSTLRVVEGSYAHHPKFREYAHLKVFLTVSEAEQANRLLARSPALFDRFKTTWIPMEERYFAGFAIPAKAQLILSTDPE